MKKLIAFVIMVSFVSCTLFTNKKEKEQTASKIESIEPDTTGYYAARELRGIYLFILNKTTIKDLKKIKTEIRKDDNLNKYCDIKEINTEPYEKTCDKIHEYSVDGFKIGNIYMPKLHLTFFNDTLIDINSKDNYSIEKAFIEKYGSGKYKFTEKTIEGKHSKIKGHHRERIWENEKAIANHWTFSDVNSNPLAGNFSISLKDSIKSKAIEECKKEYSEKRRAEREKEKQKSVDKI